MQMDKSLPVHQTFLIRRCFALRFHSIVFGRLPLRVNKRLFFSRVFAASALGAHALTLKVLPFTLSEGAPLIASSGVLVDATLICNSGKRERN
jgi:hypothetical protein